jgi:hypothetical protein
VPTTIAVELARPVVRSDRRIDLLIEARPAGPGLSTRDSAELTIKRRDGPALVTRELELKPGLWQLRVVVREAASGRIGSVLHTVEVPDGTGLHLSSPILSDALESEQLPRPRLRVSRRFEAGGALYCLYRVLGARPDTSSRTPRVSAGFALSRDGQVVQQAEPTRIEPARDGELVRLLGFGLAGYEPGEYTLLLRVVDEVSGQETSVTEPFTVVASGSSEGLSR